MNLAYVVYTTRKIWWVNHHCWVRTAEFAHNLFQVLGMNPDYSHI